MSLRNCISETSVAERVIATKSVTNIKDGVKLMV